MRVLLLFPMQDLQTGPAIKYAFEKLGHEIVAVDAKLEPDTSFCIAEDFKPDLIFCSRTYQLTEDVKRIKEKFKNTKIAMWNVDTRTDINHWQHLFPLIKLSDYYFIVDTKTIPQWRELNPNTFWLPQGLQNEIYHKPQEITEEDRKKYSCDISFAGRNRGQRRPFLSAIDKMNLNFKRWGFSGMPKVRDEEHNKMVSLSKINLCCSGWPENGSYTSVRDYKIMGAGGFVLELQRRGLDEIFPMRAKDGSIGTYVSPDDLVQRIRFWLDNEEKRKTMAERGYKWVHENATYTHRIKKALEIMGL